MSVVSLRTGGNQFANIPVVTYDEFLSRFHWQQSQHITLVGTTGCGKTTLELDLVAMRDYVIFLGTKPVDETQTELGPLGFRIAKTIEGVSLDISPKWVISPGTPSRKASANEIKKYHSRVFSEAMMFCYHQTGWSVILDEGRYICQYLGLRDEATILYLQGRSGGNSIVMGTQRPRWVPLESFDAATHLFFWKDTDRGNVLRVAELAGIDAEAVAQAVPNLESTETEGGQFLYYNTRTGDKMISKVEL